MNAWEAARNVPVDDEVLDDLLGAVLDEQAHDTQRRRPRTEEEAEEADIAAVVDQPEEREQQRQRVDRGE